MFCNIFYVISIQFIGMIMEIQHFKPLENALLSDEHFMQKQSIVVLAHSSGCRSKSILHFFNF